MKRVAFIFARGGSKGLPRKNVRELDGHPLIAHSINFAKASGLFQHVLVSTDDAEIAEVAKKYGAEVPFTRPAHLATDDSPEMLSWRHAIDYYRHHYGEFDCFVSLPAVSPLREKEDLARGLEVFQTKKCDFVISSFEAEANPYFNLYEKVAGVFVRSKVQPGLFRRQDAPKIYQLIPMYYICSPDAPSKFNTVLEGKIELFTIPKERAVDIDTADDWAFLEFLKLRLKESKR